LDFLFFCFASLAFVLAFLRFFFSASESLSEEEDKADDELSSLELSYFLPARVD
jgi:hypothetical protein